MQQKYKIFIRISNNPNITFIIMIKKTVDVFAFGEFNSQPVNVDHNPEHAPE